MKDLDFDELDRAVNSLITKAPNGSTQDSNISNEKPSVDTNITPPTLAARRSSGRFMDVVHPSSDMRSSSPMPESKNNSIESSMPIVNSTPITTPATDKPMIVEKPISKSDWPDPIDFHESNQKKDQKPAQSEDEDIDKINNEITKTLSNTSDESLESPFLSGAKVEKRPLGAFSNELPVSNVEIMSDEEKNDNKESNQDLENKEETVAPLPAELHQDLLKIEADSSTYPEKDSSVLTTKKPISTPELTTSIKQQYTEKPITSDQNSGSIYDTSSYHKNVVRPTKKKSGWMWVLWISILLVIGVGAGIVVYYFILAR